MIKEMQRENDILLAKVELLQQFVAAMGGMIHIFKTKHFLCLEDTTNHEIFRVALKDKEK